jgi:hypothetical protein
MEIRWEITSWMPFVASMVPPGDTFKLWKRGSRLRFDSHVRGMTDAAQTDNGHIAFLFTTADQVDEVGGGAAAAAAAVGANANDVGAGAGGADANAQRSVFLLDFDSAEFEDALLRFRNPPLYDDLAPGFLLFSIVQETCDFSSALFVSDFLFRRCSEMISREVSYLMAADVGKTEIECDRAHFARKSNLFGGQVWKLLLRSCHQHHPTHIHSFHFTGHL